MIFVARKVSKPKWSYQVIRADAVTGCLKTRDDTLSVWECTEKEEDIENIVLALASNMDRVDTIDIVLIPKEELEHSGFSIVETPGKVNINDESIINKHRDLSELTLDSLVALSKIVHRQVQQEEYCHRFRQNAVSKILASAVLSQKLLLDRLSDRQKSLKESIQKELKKS